MEREKGSQAAKSQTPRSHHAEVASHIPGRIRVRLHRPSRSPEVLKNIRTSLETQPGVSEVAVNQAAGSVTVTYDQDVHPGMRILELLKDVDVIVSTLAGAPHIVDGHDGTSEADA